MVFFRPILCNVGGIGLFFTIITIMYYVNYTICQKCIIFKYISNIDLCYIQESLRIE
jgi:hypothetical protein